MRSHPPTLFTTAKRTLLEECGPLGGVRVLVAVSGGPDSMALLHVLARLGPRLGFQIVAHGVDHGLRPEARAELDLVAEFSAQEGVSFSRSLVSVAPGGNLQARARAARYAALREAAARQGATLIATAHHADDRAETVLLRLLRGTSVRGLAVLPPRSGDLIRPFVRARKVDVTAHVVRHRVPAAEDPSNDDPRFLRVRVRRLLVPLLVELSPQIVDNLNALADDAGELLPSVLDEAGELVTLNRAQLRELRRARRAGARERVFRLSGGRLLRVNPATGRGRS
jgi:tRNA(Ile)-lysidine synthase